MNIFVDYYFEKLKDMVNVNFLPDDFVDIFKKCSYYKIDVQGYCLMIGTESVFDYLISDDNKSILEAIFHTESILISHVDDMNLVQFVQIIHTLNIVALNILNQTPVIYAHR